MTEQSQDRIHLPALPNVHADRYKDLYTGCSISASHGWQNAFIPLRSLEEAEVLVQGSITYEYRTWTTTGSGT